MAERSRDDGALVQLSERLTNSTAFSNLFREGMDLVEETAAYLDGPGRTEAKALERSVSLSYATESMRLTTRLMQLASWLLLQRAIASGELGSEEARKEKNRITVVTGAATARLTNEDCKPETSIHYLMDTIALGNVVGKAIVKDGGTKVDEIVAKKAASEPPVARPVTYCRAASWKPKSSTDGRLRARMSSARKCRLWSDITRSATISPAT